MKTTLSMLTVGALLASAGAIAAPSTLLLEDPAFRTSVTGPVDCNGPVDVNLITRDPALLDSDTSDVQRVMDASLAMLRYQCPNLSRIEVRGSLQDRNEESFVAMLEHGDDWLVRVQRAFTLDVSSGSRVDKNRRQSTLLPAGESRLAVVGLAAGMSPAMVRNILASNFDSEPRILDGGRRMVVEENGCRVDRQWTTRSVASGARSGWRCLEAWFTPGDNAMLYKVVYEEVVDGNRLEDATNRLISRYGEPDVRENRVWLHGQPTGKRYSWGNEITIDGEDRRELQADIRPSSRMTIVGLNLSDQNVLQSRAFRF